MSSIDSPAYAARPRAASPYSPLSNAHNARSTQPQGQDVYQPAPRALVQAYQPVSPQPAAPAARSHIAPQTGGAGRAPVLASTQGDGLAGRSVDIAYKSDSAGTYPEWLAPRMDYNEFRTVHRRLRSAYIKGRVDALYANGLVSAITCHLATPFMHFATKGKVQKQRIKEARNLTMHYGHRGIRFEVSSSSPVTIQMRLS